MKKRLVGIFISTLLIASVFLATGSLDNVVSDQSGNESTNKEIYEIIVDDYCNYPYQEYALGYAPIPDWVERTRLPEPTEPLLADLDWRNNGGDYTTPAKNQGNCGSCWAHSAMGALEAMIAIANNNPNLNYDLSEQYVISCTGAQSGSPNDCTMGHPYWAFWYMKDSASQNGALPESCFPYQGIDANGCDFYSCNYTPVLCSNKCSNWQTQLIQTITGYGYGDVNYSGLTPAQIKAQLANGPVCLCMYVYTDFNPGPGSSSSFDSNGIYRWDGVSAYVGGHSVLCVGYQDSLGCWICKNSWGTTWGNMNGFFKIAYGQPNIENEITWVTFTPPTNNAPTVSITSPTPGAPVSSSITIQGAASDSDGSVIKVEVSIDSGSWWTVSGTTSWTTNWDTTTVSDGSHVINARSLDNIGAYSLIAAVPVLVNNAGNSPPNKPSTPNGPTTGVTGVQYQYTTSATDPDSGDQIKYGWDFNNDGIVDPGHWTGLYTSGAICTLGVTFTSPGTYYLSAIAEDNHGAQSAFSSMLTVVISTGTNNPPTVSITSPSSGSAISGSITIQGIAGDSDGTVIQVEVCIDSGNWWTASGTASWTMGWDTTTVIDGSHMISARSKDNTGAYSTIASTPVTVNNAVNRPPNKPSTPSGKTSGKAGTVYYYNSSAIDLDGDQVSLLFDWGDGTNSGWLTPVNSGQIVTASHSWSKATYEIKVKARDIPHVNESVWSDPLPISMPYSITPLLQFVELLFQRFPNEFPLLRQLLGH